MKKRSNVSIKPKHHNIAYDHFMDGEKYGEFEQLYNSIRMKYLEGIETGELDLFVERTRLRMECRKYKGIRKLFPKHRDAHVVHTICLDVLRDIEENFENQKVNMIERALMNGTQLTKVI